MLVAAASPTLRGRADGVEGAAQMGCMNLEAEQDLAGRREIPGLQGLRAVPPHLYTSPVPPQRA